MANSEYQSAKAALKMVAKEAKQNHRGDKPAIRQAINDTADSLTRDFPLSWSDKKRAKYTNKLSDYACTLHPKNT